MPAGDSTSRLKELQCYLELVKEMNAELEGLVQRTGSLIIERRKKLNRLLVEIEKWNLEEQHLTLLEKTLDMLEKSRGVQSKEVATMKKLIDSWEDRLQAVECRLDKMGVVMEPSTSTSMFSKPWLLK